MNWLKNAAAELLGLFVDDWLFAVLVVAWIGAAALLGRQAPAPAAVLLFAGFAALTLAFAIRRARH